MAAGADRLELDVHATRDGHVVVLHDATLDRTTDGTGPIRERTLAEVEALDAGFRFTTADGRTPHRGRGIRVPTLDALLAAHPGVPLNIEIKQADPPIEHAVLAVLDRHGARASTILAAEHQPLLDRIRHAAPDVATGFSAEEVADLVFRLRDGRLGDWRPVGVALQVPPQFGDIAIVTPAAIAAAHDRGVEVHVWTINEPAEMERLLDLGVDGIMTDFPGRAVEILRRRGLR